MDAIFTLVMLGLLVAAFAPMPHRRTGGLLDLFGGGFVRYRGDPRWPHGVQEEDLVAWTVDASTPRDRADGPAPIANVDETAVPEIIELDTRSAVDEPWMRRVRRR